MAEKTFVASRAGGYPVVIGDGLDFGKLALESKERCRAVVTSDRAVFPLHGEAVLGSLAAAGYDALPCVIEAGEGSKSMEALARMLGFFADAGLARRDLVVALGGGVVGDLAGFASAVYMRGIDFIQIPTTVLAAVDSSVGGKTGVNLPGGKNLAGAFHSPIAVFCDVRHFATLPPAVRADGMAEAVKHGMIADGDMLRRLGEMPMAEICRRNVEIKAAIVGRDEFEAGARMVLNFGHTVGHAAEALSGYRIPHGSAVAMGMSVIARAGARLGLTEPECPGELAGALGLFGLPSSCGFSAGDLARAALRDKKRSGGSIALAVPKRVGLVEMVEIPVADLEGFISEGLEA